MKEKPGTPSTFELPRGVVAIPLRAGEFDLNFLLIRRVERAGDPWSGQMAFPGGHMEPSDASEFDTARRETQEETGIDILTHEVLGRLDDVQPSNLAIRVTPFVVALIGEVNLRASAEVAEHLWIPFKYFQRPVRKDFVVQRGQKSATFEAYDFQGRIIWGMTLRIIKDIVSRLENKLS